MVMIVPFGLAACTEDKPDHKAVGEIRIGLVTSTSGPGAAAGADAERGARLAADIVNSDLPALALPLGPGAGLPKFGGAKLTVVTADAAGKSEQAVTKAVSLVATDGVRALVTAESAEITGAVTQRTERLRIPSIDGRSSAGFLTSLGLDFYFRTSPADRDLGSTAFSLLRTKGPGVRRVAIIDASDDSATTLVPALRDLAGEAGYEIVVTADFPPGGGEPANAAGRRVRTATPDAVLAVADTPGDAAAAVRAIQGPAPALPIVGLGPGFVSSTFPATIGSVGESVFRVTPWSAQLVSRQPVAKAVADRYQQLYKAPISDVAAGAFTATLTLATAVNDARSTDADKIRVALLGTRVSGSRTIMPWDGVAFRENGQNTLAGGAVEQLTVGTFQVVYPRELASVPVVWPGG
jgi:branched-chain amino acid transport system substrate-binding protein